MKRFAWIIGTVLFAGSFAAGADAPERKTVVEISRPRPRADFVGTVGYATTEKERPFQGKVTEKPVNHWAGLQMPPAENVKVDPKEAAEQKKAQEEELVKAKAYTLGKQAGEYVGWFAIVRESVRNEAEHRTELLLQHCYADGLSDPDVQVVSIYGSGDFRAVLQGGPENVPLLSLVCVYGKVSLGKDAMPEVAADYVRVWDWGLFTFMDYGIDRTNAKWQALRQVDGKDVYDPHPSRQYYEKVLGKRSGAGGK